MRQASAAKAVARNVYQVMQGLMTAPLNALGGELSQPPPPPPPPPLPRTPKFFFWVGLAGRLPKMLESIFGQLLAKKNSGPRWPLLEDPGPKPPSSS